MYISLHLYCYLWQKFSWDRPCFLFGRNFKLLVLDVLELFRTCDQHTIFPLLVLSVSLYNDDTWCIRDMFFPGSAHHLTVVGSEGLCPKVSPVHPAVQGHQQAARQIRWWGENRKFLMYIMHALRHRMETYQGNKHRSNLSRNIVHSHLSVLSQCGCLLGLK